MGEESRRARRKIRDLGRILVKEDSRARYNQVADILKIPQDERTEEQKTTLDVSSDIVEKWDRNMRKRQLQQSRRKEVCDSWEDIAVKCKQLSEVIARSSYMVVYTGAGISTSALIPDYRGPNGVWTLQNKGIQPRVQDLVDSSPTYTHMALSELMRQGKIKYIVSQNCDGLHVRSGVDRSKLSELHGNMFLEVCDHCTGEDKEYMRLCDVTERTGVRKHFTGRYCNHCNHQLHDTIVHFGEKGSMNSPYNWHEAHHAAENADLIMCLGTSLKVLKKYSCLWSLNKPVKRRAPLYIINLQWTPKDDIAQLKIHGNCDDVMRLIMENLNITTPTYHLYFDPLFSISVPFTDVELESINKNQLKRPDTWDHSYTPPYSNTNSSSSLPTTTKTRLTGSATSPRLKRCDYCEARKDILDAGTPDSESLSCELTKNSAQESSSHCQQDIELPHSNSKPNCSVSETNGSVSKKIDCCTCDEYKLSVNGISIPKIEGVSQEGSASQDEETPCKILKSDCKSKTSRGHTNNINNTAPGWYGLGYRKRKRRRKGFLT